MEAEQVDGDVGDAERCRLRALTLWTGTMAWDQGTHQRNGDASYGGEGN